MKIKTKEKKLFCRIYLLFYILAMGICLLIFYRVLYSTQQISEKEINHQYIGQINDSNKFVQQFVAKKQNLNSISLWIVNEDLDVVTENDEDTKQNNDGEIIVSLLNKNKNLICKQIINITNITNSDLDFEYNQKLKKNEIYYIEVSSQNISGSNIYLYGSEYKGKIFNDLQINDNSIDNLRMNVKFYFQVFDFAKLIIFVLMLLGIFIILYLKDWEIWIQYGLKVLLPILIPILTFYFVERIQGNNILASKLNIILANLIFYEAIYAFFCVLLNNISLASIIYLFTFYVIGLLNRLIVSFRGIPICPWDINSINTAINVSNQYQIILTDKEILILLIIIFISLILINIPTKIFMKGNYKWNIISKFVSIIILSLLIFTQQKYNWIEKEPFNLKGETWLQINGYNYNGFLASFMINLKYIDVQKPIYSYSDIQQVYSDYTDDEIDDNQAVATPNIIVIMNESFADLATIGDFETNINYMPFISSLEENVVKGNAYVSVFGGNTANSEFEFLTGFTTSFLPEGSVAYQSFYSNKVKNETLLDRLRIVGYKQLLAVHPLDASGWNRDSVYSNMGFDRFYSIVDFDDYNEVRGLVSDSSDYEFVENIINESNDNKFVFNVTIQNHGGYLVDDYQSTVKLSNMEYSDVEQYLSLIRESDEAFKELVDYYTDKEPTIVLMFGDHYPSLDQSFYEEIYGKGLEDLTLEELQKRYSIPFIMWANYDIEEEYIDGISLNYLSSWMLNKLELPLSAYNKYLLDLYKEIPVINRNGYMDSNKNFHSFNEQNEYYDKIEQYRSIQYYKLIKYNR